MGWCVPRSRGNLGLDRRGEGENSPRQRNLTLSLPKIWCEDSKTNLMSKRCRMLLAGFFTEVNSHHHPAYPSLNLPRDRGTHQPILLWNCYVTAAPALLIRPTRVSRKLSKRKYDGCAPLRTPPTIDRISAGAEPSIFKNATDNRAIRGGLTRS